MKLRYLFEGACFLLIFQGIWVNIKLSLELKGYASYNGSFYNYLSDVYPNKFSLKFIQKLGLEMFINSKLYRVFLRIKGILTSLLGVALLILLFSIRGSQYGMFLEVKL